MRTNYLILCVSLFVSLMSVNAAPTKGLQFTGASSSYIDGGMHSAFSPAQFTIEVWAYYENTSGGYLVSTEGWDGTNGAQGFSVRTSGARLELSLGADGSWPSIQSVSDLPLNQWVHVAATYSGTEIKLFLNGVEDGSTTITTPMVTSNHNLSIGEGSMWKDRRFTGKMSDLRFWNIVRSQEEILSSMSNSLTGTEDGLVANWKMNEGSGNSIADATGNYSLTKNDDVLWFDLNTSLSSLSSAKVDVRVFNKNLILENRNDETVTFTVYNISGQMVDSGKLTSGAIVEKQMDVYSGVFVIECISDKGLITVNKFVL
jgi:hypothetical protein